MNKKDMTPKGIAERVCKLIDLDIELLSEYDAPSVRINLSEQLHRYKKAQRRVEKDLYCSLDYQLLCRKVNKLDFLLNGVKCD